MAIFKIVLQGYILINSKVHHDEGLHCDSPNIHAINTHQRVKPELVHFSTINMLVLTNIIRFGKYKEK
jgi:hypothetical protein